MVYSLLLWTIGCSLGASGVGFGAFGAHALKKFVTDPSKIRSWETAAHYQIFHAAPILLAATNSNMQIGGWLLTMGATLFSGSIYILVLRPKWRSFGPLTPVGGLLLMVGWMKLAISY